MKSLPRLALQGALAGTGAAMGLLHLCSVRLNLRLGVRYLHQPRPDDIFIVTYPKSGTTLLQMILYQLTTDGEPDFTHIDGVFPWLDMDCMRGRVGWHASLPSPRVFKSHLRYGMLPREGRFIYVARDLRGVTASAYHHQYLISGVYPDREQFVRGFLRRWLVFGSWSRHLGSWWPHRKDPDVLFLTFGQVVRDREGTVRRIADFCGLPLNEEELPRILERSSLDFMKRHSEKFDPRLRTLSGPGAEFIRQGKDSGWKQDLTAADLSRIEAERTRLARRLGVEPDEPHAELFWPASELLSSAPAPTAEIA